MALKPENLDIIFGNPRRVYWAGETITGSLVLCMDKIQTIASLQLIFTGKVSVSFCQEGIRKRHDCCSNESYFNKRIFILPRAGAGGDRRPVIEPGNHEFPFEFKLPSDIPSSFACQAGSVRYTIKARLEVGWKESVTIHRYFIVFQPLDLNFQSDNADVPRENESEKTLCLLCCRPTGGNIKVKVSIQQTGYVPGQAIPFRAEVINNTCFRIIKMYFTICQVSQCLAAGKVATESKQLIISSPVHPGISARSADIWCNGESYHVRVPVSVPTGLVGCNIISIKHQLVLNIEIGGPFCKMMVPIDIIIGTVPLANSNFSDGDSRSPSAEANRHHYIEPHGTSRLEGRGHIYDTEPPVYCPRVDGDMQTSQQPGTLT